MPAGGISSTLGKYPEIVNPVQSLFAVVCEVFDTLKLQNARDLVTDSVVNVAVPVVDPNSKAVPRLCTTSFPSFPCKVTRITWCSV